MAGIVGGLLALGVVLKLIMAILEPVLPAPLMGEIQAGWDMFFQLIAPAMPAIIAVGILCAIGWIILGARR
ncbi:hypothetical protein AB5J62_29920 [Amycolatopsis sp. cg5]|uniref:hypothetical protein n=1 Tax=Amycolatopsis sp. cg5 TaxID=3238802 RepID=UPI00352606F5